MKSNVKTLMFFSVLVLVSMPVFQSTTTKVEQIACFERFSGRNPEVRGQSVQNVTFSLLAVEQYSDHSTTRSAQDLIRSLRLFRNWQNATVSAGFQYFNYIHLLSNVNYEDIDPDCQPYYRGNVTRANVLDEISIFLSQTSPGENNALSVRIFYYIGQSNKAVTQGNTSYYLALDQPIFDWELNETLLSGVLQNSNNTLIILDSCYGGGYIANLARTGRVILTACNPVETAKRGLSPEQQPLNRWGWFTGHENASYSNGAGFGPLGIIGGIRTANDINNDGWRSADEIFQFARSTTTCYAANQTNPETQKPYDLHPWASYGVAGGAIPLVQCDLSKPFPCNAKACHPLPVSTTPSRYNREEFEHRMYRHTPSRTGFSQTIGPEKLNCLWVSSLKDSVTSSAAVADGMVFVGTMGGTFYALDVETGEIIWSLLTNSSISSSAAVKDGMVFFATHKPGKIYAVDEYTGLVRWVYEVPMGASVYSSPVVVDGTVFVGSSDGYLRALTQFEGKLVWTRHIGGAMRCSPAVADGLVFVGSSHVYALNKTTGSLIWEFVTSWPVFSSLAVADGVVYVGAGNDDKVFALDEMTGTLVWSFQTSGWVSSPAVDSVKNVIIVGCRDCRVYCLNARTGWLKWQFISGSTYLSSPTIAINGLVYVGSSNGYVYCIDEDTGEEVWKYKTEGSIASSPSVIREHVLIGSEDGNLYCFGPSFAVHNVAVLNATVSATNLSLGESVEIRYTMKNNGNVDETINVSIAYNSSEVWVAPKYLELTIIHTETITLTAKANLTNTYNWNTTDVGSGLYTISVQADLLPDEIDASDNTFISPTITLGDLDIAVTNIIPSKTIVGQGYSMFINVTVENQGDTVETFDVTAYANTTAIQTKTVTLTSRNSTTISFTWNTTGFVYGNITLSAYAALVPGETDTEDNTYINSDVKVVIPGDVDGDGNVDLYDVVKTCAAYGSGKGDLAYDANLDINGDDEIDLYDVVIASIHYGQKEP